MIVPQYWAEGRIQQRLDKRQITVRRFGWSDLSLADAQTMADARTAEAFAKVVAGAQLERREPKVPYNGAEGVPIREEILARYGETVITRNSYGAHCLNTPNVLFVDVDFDKAAPTPWVRKARYLLLALGGIAFAFYPDILTVAAAFLVAISFGRGLADWWRGRWIAKKGGLEKVAMGRIEVCMAAHTKWHVRVYRTPKGLRLLGMHSTFDPQEQITRIIFDALGTDWVYSLMCRKQGCFRARVSPKPWRVGIGDHMRPRPGAWPIAPERIPERKAWVDRYERASRSFAACSFVAAMGDTSQVCPEAAMVQGVHDQLSQSSSGLPIA